MAEKVNRIAEWRKKRGLSQPALADKLGTHWVTVSKLERGVQRLTYDWMVRLGEALGIEPHHLMMEERRIADLQIGGEVEESGEVYIYADDQMHKTGVYSSVFDEVYNDWFFVRSDVLWPYFKKGDLLGMTQTDRPSEDFIGRFCVLHTDDNKLFMGLLSHGSRHGLFNLQVGRSKPMIDLKGHVFSYLAHAIFELPERPVINKVAQDDLRAAYDSPPVSTLTSGVRAKPR